MSAANTLVSGALYYIGNAAVDPSWVLYVDNTLLNDLGVGPMNNGLTLWNLTQHEDQGGMWTIKQAYNRLSFGYSGTAVDNIPIETVNASVSGEIYWDVWKSDTGKDGHYQFFVHNTYLTATLSENTELGVYPVYITNAFGTYEEDYPSQNWVITNI